jgi:hypothetical protein
VPTLTASVLWCFLWSGALADDPPPKSLLDVEGRATFVLQHGRIVLEPRRYDRGTWSLTPSEQHEEFLCITASRGIPSLHYQKRASGEQLVLDLLDANTCKLRYQSATGPVVCFEQPARGRIRAWLDHEPDLVFEADSLWHLAVQRPHWFAEHLDPILMRLLQRPGLVSQLGEIKASQQNGSAHSTAATVDISPDRVQCLIKQLEDPRLPERASAERELIAMGPSLLRYLDQPAGATPPAAEAAVRLRRIRRLLMPQHGDTAATVAQWLAIDRPWHESLASLSSGTSLEESLRR